jgi:DNA-binding Xre family transcriptional regulator
MGNLAKRLAKRLREARGHTSQLQFAAKLGVTLDTLETLCHKLRCDVGDLFPR